MCMGAWVQCNACMRACVRHTSTSLHRGSLCKLCSCLPCLAHQVRNTEDLEVPPQLRDRVQMLTDLDYQASCCGAQLAACLSPLDQWVLSTVAGGCWLAAEAIEGLRGVLGAAAGRTPASGGPPLHLASTLLFLLLSCSLCSNTTTR